MNKTNIEYLTHTWNPIAMRCAPVSEGCKNCWHLSLAKRLAKNPLIPEDRQKTYMGGKPVLIEKELLMPLKLRKSKTPAIIGVQFMGDLFHEDVPYEIQSPIFAEMILNPQHTYLVLTKRPENMFNFLERFIFMGGYWFDVPVKYHPHIWLGVTCENQRTADERIPILLQIPAAIHFISCEPLLSEINLEDYLSPLLSETCNYGESHREKTCDCQHNSISWTICGGESGPGARPMNPDWAKSIKNQCQSAGVPFFFKQMSGTKEERQVIPDDLMSREYPTGVK